MLVFEPAGSGVGDSDIYMVEFCCRLFRLFDGRDNLQNCLQSTAAYGAAGVRIFARDYCPAGMFLERVHKADRFSGFPAYMPQCFADYDGYTGLFDFLYFPARHCYFAGHSCFAQHVSD